MLNPCWMAHKSLNLPCSFMPLGLCFWRFLGLQEFPFHSIPGLFKDYQIKFCVFCCCCFYLAFTEGPPQPSSFFYTILDICLLGSLPCLGQGPCFSLLFIPSTQHNFWHRILRCLENIFKGIWCALDKMGFDVLMSMETLGRNLGNLNIGGSINQDLRSECSKCHHHICTKATFLRGPCQPVRGPFPGDTRQPLRW